MSVFLHEYQPYSGRTTARWSRPLVLARYGMAEAWSSKITVGLFVLSFLPCLVEMVMIYVSDNPAVRILIGHGTSALDINEKFFLGVLETQCWFALALASWVAPRLLSFDLADNALPILLSHPITRFGYLAGKFIGVFVTLSYVTWVPCLILFVYQSYASPQPWAMLHLGIAFGIFVGSILWIALLSLIGLAVSSWVKWRVIATGAIFAVVFVPAGVGGIAMAILRTKWGLLLNVPVIMTELWMRLLGVPRFGDPKLWLPTGAIVSVLIVAGLMCIAVLNARVRAREVVRG